MLLARALLNAAVRDCRSMRGVCASARLGPLSARAITDAFGNAGLFAETLDAGLSGGRR